VVELCNKESGVCSTDLTEDKTLVTF